MRVIRIFKSRLFQALLDVQEFYELTLMDETKSTDVKTAEARPTAAGTPPPPAPAPSRLPPKPAPSPAAVPPPDPAPALAVAARPSAMAWSVSAAANDKVIAKAFWFSSMHLTQN